jgi:hypothetical protein
VSRPAFTDVLPPEAAVKSVKIEADGAACAGDGVPVAAFLNSVRLGTAAAPPNCVCTDCTTKTWEDASLPEGWLGYNIGGPNVVSFTDDLFAWAVTVVQVTYEVPQSAACVCPPGYAYDEAAAACKGAPQAGPGEPAPGVVSAPLLLHPAFSAALALTPYPSLPPPMAQTSTSARPAPQSAQRKLPAPTPRGATGASAAT